ncbi:MAG: LapA family protein [Deltaproteobacteria bacterium]|uniref:LapA family protein n=1 Tax=Candidatus Zymogenus saltonus TaxID=2844893 RepID=A0A9D8KF50_9DELT|nr:LapA family protein [Candidatus Zymogenus saltonus]
MKYIKIILFTAIVMILVLFAVRNQGMVNFVLGYKTTFMMGTEAKEEVNKEKEIKEKAGTEAATPNGEVPTGTEAGVEFIPSDEVTAPESVVVTETEKAPREIGYEREFEIPLFLLVFIEAFVLILLMSLVGIFEDISLRQRIRGLNKENKKMKSELNILKKGEREPEKTKAGKTEEGAKITDEEKSDKGKKEAKKKGSFLKNIKGEKKTLPEGEDKGL